MASPTKKELKKHYKRIKRRMKNLGIPHKKHTAGILFKHDGKVIRMVKLYRRRFRVEPEYYCFLTDKCRTHLYVILGPLKNYAQKKEG